ncbi:MAG: sulfatase-like hydrolase/transferase [Planctomycetota bacterium]
MGSTAPAVCIPSRSMLLTGRLLYGLRGCGAEIPPEFTTLGEHLRDQGYTAFHTGMWHQDRASFRRSFDSGAKIRGFAKRWYEECNGHWHHAVHDYDATGTYAQEAGYLSTPPLEPFEPPFTITEPRPGCEHSSETFTDAAIGFLEAHAGGGETPPFFCHLPYVAVHDPLQAPQEFFDLYAGHKLSLYPNYAPQHPFDNGELHVRDEALLPWPRTEAMVRRRKRELYAMITHLDAQIGRLLDTLDRTGLAETTIIAFTADHGCAHGQHGLVGKQNLYDHSIRVPLILAGPGIRQGQSSGALCYLSDLFPTLCDLAGLPVPKSVEGLSFAPCLEGSEGACRPWLHLAYRHVQRAVREGDWKLIQTVVGGVSTLQLFNPSEDPWEICNRVEEEACRGVREALLKRLEEGRERFGDCRPDHGGHYWEAQAAAVPGQNDPSPFKDVQPLHQSLWRQAVREAEKEAARHG